MDLSNSPLGVKRRLRTVGLLEWSHENKFIIFRFVVESIDAQGNLLTDKVVNQSREVRYVLTNSTKVDTQFNVVANGGTGEYDFFINALGNTLFLTLIGLLETKLNSRGIFD